MTPPRSPLTKSSWPAPGADRGTRSQLAQDRRQHKGHAPADVIGREADNAEPARIEPGCSRRVVGGRPVIHLAANLHNQPRRHTREVDDVGPEQRLTPKLETVQPPPAQARPHDPLDAPHSAAKVSTQTNAQHN